MPEEFLKRPDAQVKENTWIYTCKAGVTNMDLEYYRNFIKIAETGSISGAAKKLSVAQPALSNQIKLLQRYYDARLINVKRGGHTLELTDAGKILLRRARALVAEEEFAVKEIADSRAGFSGTLRISLSPSMSIWFISRYLSKFSRKYPKINYELHELTAGAQEEQVLSGETEFIIANGMLEHPYRFETIYRRKERLMAFFHKNSLFLHGSSPNMLLDDFEEMPVCLSRRCASLFLSVCSDSGIHPRVLSVTTTKLSAMTWAVQDLGIVVVPSELEDLVPEDMVRKNIMDERMYVEKTLSIVKGRPLSHVGKIFLNFFKEEF